MLYTDNLLGEDILGGLVQRQRDHQLQAVDRHVLVVQKFLDQLEDVVEKLQLEELIYPLLLLRRLAIEELREVQMRGDVEALGAGVDALLIQLVVGELLQIGVDLENNLKDVFGDHLRDVFVNERIRVEHVDAVAGVGKVVVWG